MLISKQLMPQRDSSQLLLSRILGLRIMLRISKFSVLDIALISSLRSILRLSRKLRKYVLSDSSRVRLLVNDMWSLHMPKILLLLTAIRLHVIKNKLMGFKKSFRIGRIFLLIFSDDLICFLRVLTWGVWAYRFCYLQFLYQSSFHISTLLVWIHFSWSIFLLYEWYRQFRVFSDELILYRYLS